MRAAVAAGKTVNIMTGAKKRHSAEQILRKIQQADRILAEGAEDAAVLKKFNITEATHQMS